jgi:LAGLIDADG endonuclease
MLEKPIFIYIFNLLNLKFKRVNQQVTIKKVGTSETESKISFIFNIYYKSINIINYDNKFLEWFIGFTEGDGSFIISKNKIFFDITQNIQDVQVLYYIKNKLGFGQVLLREESNRQVGVFYVTSKENFLKLIHIFNGNICSNYKHEQFKVWLNTFNNQYKENIIWIDKKREPNLFTGWLSGFIDAEGSFGGRVKYCRTSKIKKAPHLSLSITQKEFYILSLIRNLFVNNNKCISYDKSWDGWRLHISSFKTLILVINYLRLYPLKTKKSIAFIRFIELHNKIMKKEHLNINGITEIEKLIKKINKNER